MDVDLTSLNKAEMAEEIMASLSAHGVDVNYGREGWTNLLQAISEGIIVHLQKHEAAFSVPAGNVVDISTGGTPIVTDHGHKSVAISVAASTRGRRT